MFKEGLLFSTNGNKRVRKAVTGIKVGSDVRQKGKKML
jgi:hypothetical protein